MKKPHARLHKIRTELGLSLTQIAQLADVSTKTVSRMETGAGINFNRVTYHRLLNAVNKVRKQRALASLSLADLFPDAEAKQTPPSKQTRTETRRGERQAATTTKKTASREKAPDIPTADSAPAFEAFFSPELSPEQIKSVLDALGDYFRACGGAGLKVEFETQKSKVLEPVDA